MLNTAIQAALRAGKILNKKFNKLAHVKYKMKSCREIVTEADLAAEKIILDLIRKKYPEHRILSEEVGEINGKFFKVEKSDYLWLIDPLDGTTNFSIKNPLFNVSIGLAYKGEMILGVIYAPCTDELFTAQKGRGSYLNGKQIKVSQKSKVRNSILLAASGRRKIDDKKMIELYSYFKLKTRNFRQFGSAALELAFVAAGRVEGMIVVGCSPWDMAAGALIIKEAGGKVTNFAGASWNIKDKNLLACGPKIHPNVLKVLRRLKIE
ncbi:MAG: inositol monophosphatase [Parcubacteria group bacterium CG23_combo_of_CG06-09_8_20_14_all_35_9]|nr:MAG: inositol monophosphatase [Parcubacteria group bacterium CG23_combo_of_CG06-09_8_20_14_all_35_9]